MLTIRLRRTGGKKDPHFRVVVADSRTNRDGPFIEVLGHYHPRRDPAEFTIDREATDSWVEKGAQLSDTVRTLIRQLEAGKVRAPQPPGRPAAAADEAATAPEDEAADSAEEEPEEKAAESGSEDEEEAAEQEDEDDEDEESGSDEEE